ncbi:transposase [Streptomyces sp. t39]|nr:transposase [Streptomyces sp. t39]
MLSDELCSLIEPLLPEPGPKSAAARPRVPDRQALWGILFVLHTGSRGSTCRAVESARACPDRLASPKRDFAHLQFGEEQGRVRSSASAPA